MKQNKKAIAVAGLTAALSMSMVTPVFADDFGTGASVNLLDADVWSNRAVTDVDDYANVRSSADISGDLVGVLLPGCVVTVEETVGDWTHIVSGNVDGYIRSDLLVTDTAAQEIFLEKYHLTGTVDVAVLNVRSGASMADDLIGTVTEGDKLELLSYENGWFQVDYNDEVGYIAGEYVIANDTEYKAMTIDEYDAYLSAEDTDAETEVDEDASNTSNTISVTDEELKLLAAIIHCEAGGESQTGRVAVGAVVLNRVNSASFPGTIRDVVYQSGQFTPAMTGWLDTVLGGEVDADCYAAARAALAGEDPTDGCLYFHAGGGNGLTIGNQTFYNV